MNFPEAYLDTLGCSSSSKPLTNPSLHKTISVTPPGNLKNVSSKQGSVTLVTPISFSFFFKTKKKYIIKILGVEGFTRKRIIYLIPHDHPPDHESFVCFHVGCNWNDLPRCSHER